MGDRNWYSPHPRLNICSSHYTSMYVHQPSLPRHYPFPVALNCVRSQPIFPIPMAKLTPPDAEMPRFEGNTIGFGFVLRRHHPSWTYAHNYGRTCFQGIRYNCRSGTFTTHHSTRRVPKKSLVNNAKAPSFLDLWCGSVTTTCVQPTQGDV